MLRNNNEYGKIIVMGLGDEILFFLSQNPGNYRSLRARMLGDLYLKDKLEQSAWKKREKRAQENKLYVTISRLKKNGLVENNNHLWSLTRLGSKKLKKYESSKTYHPYPKIKKSNKKVIIAFDIPEADRRNRGWLRIELVSLGFKILQKSVWLGPAPLPKEFINNLKFMKLLPYLKFFEVKETDIT